MERVAIVGGLLVAGEREGEQRQGAVEPRRPPTPRRNQKGAPRRLGAAHQRRRVVRRHRQEPARRGTDLVRASMARQSKSGGCHPTSSATLREHSAFSSRRSLRLERQPRLGRQRACAPRCAHRCSSSGVVPLARPPRNASALHRAADGLAATGAPYVPTRRPSHL